MGEEREVGARSGRESGTRSERERREEKRERERREGAQNPGGVDAPGRFFKAKL
jgi:hypothetical protein